MKSVKDEAVSAYLKEQKEVAKKAFQVDVNALLDDIGDLSRRLKAAKKRFSDLEYKEPEALDI